MAKRMSMRVMTPKLIGKIVKKKKKPDQTGSPRQGEVVGVSRLTRHPEASFAAEMGLSGPQLFDIRND